MIFWGSSTFSATTLGAGDIVILEFNGNGTDGFSFMPLVNLSAGTKINFTDYGWNAGSGTFNTTDESSSGNGNMITYTASGAVSAGTIIRQDASNVGGAEFTPHADWAYNYSNQNYIHALMSTVAGHDGIIAFQGTPTSPTFIWAYQTGQWNGTDYYYCSDLPTGLTNGVNAIYFADLESGSDLTVDDGYYKGPYTEATAADWRSRVANSSNWTSIASGTAPALLYPNTYTVTDASLPVKLSSFNANLLGNNIFLSWQTESETDNLGFVLERAEGNGAWQPIASYKTHPALKGKGNASTTTTYSFRDNTVATGTEYRYRLGDVNTAGVVTMHSPIAVTTTVLPQSTAMLNAYPNPFNPETTINYQLHMDSQVSITVYDLLGRTVKTLIDEQQVAGSYHAIWNGTDEAGAKAASGAYLVRMQTQEITQTQKVLLLK